MQYIVTDYRETGRGRIELCLNEKVSFWIYKKEAGDLDIREGAELSEEKYQYLLHEIIGKRVTKRAMHILERQERTEYQLREKLLQCDYPKEAVEDAIIYVKRYHYVDDARYARTFIRYHQENRSRMRIQNDLRQRGVPADIIAASMEEEFASDERQKICRLLEKKGFSAEEADQNERRKMYQFLMRRGFRSSDISAVMRGSIWDN